MQGARLAFMALSPRALPGVTPGPEVGLTEQAAVGSEPGRGV
jgi:hypothetical protein